MGFLITKDLCLFLIIEFTTWFSWKRRNEIENSKYPGIYILAKFTTQPSGAEKTERRGAEKNRGYINGSVAW